MADERKLILERLKTEAKVVGTTTTDFFSSNVPESKMRYVVSIFIMGDGVASRVVDIYKKEEDGTYTPKFLPDDTSCTGRRQAATAEWLRRNEPDLGT
jgi:hypothetical protein